MSTTEYPPPLFLFRAQRLQGAMLRSSEGGIGIRIGPRPNSCCRTLIPITQTLIPIIATLIPIIPTLIPAPARPCPRILEEPYRRVPGPRPDLQLPCLPIPILRARIPAYHSPPAPTIPA